MSQKPNPTGPKALYQQRLNNGDLAPDPMQAAAADVLERLHGDLCDYPEKRGWFAKKSPTPIGVYMHGGVGRGKSMLMDLFYDCVPSDGPRGFTKRRAHFHEFMIGVHDYLHAQKTDRDQSITKLTKKIAAESRVLCFDEFHVTDVADAMILGRLFSGLFDRGVVIVATSNWELDRLYEGGLQRDRFEVFIALMKQRMQIVHLDSPTDYRTKFIAQEGSYFHPFSAEGNAKANALFEKLTDGAAVESDVLEVKGREITVAETAKGVARFTFAELCERPRGAEDYIAITKRYHTVFLECVPKLGYDRRNEAKRLMTLIDALYEAKTKLIIVADAAPDQLYRGHDHAFEFDRTISRLMEMQSGEYLDQKRPY